MKSLQHLRASLFAVLLLLTAVPAFPQAGTVRLAGTVRDEANAIALPGVPVEVVGTNQTVFTDVDGRYVVDVKPGDHELRVTLDGYQTTTVQVTATAGQRTVTVDMGMTMSRLAETVTVEGVLIDLPTTTAEAQVAVRRQAQVITDNVGAQEMKDNGDSDAAAAMSRVTGVSVVDNQYVFVRGLGERYSNTTLAGSILPTTEPDKKVVPLDLFPSGLIDSVQIAKSYSPDKSAEFAGGLVQIVPLKFPTNPVVDMSYGFNFGSTSTGKSIPLSPLGSRDWVGFDSGARAMPSSFPDSKIVRQGLYTPDVGYAPDQITNYGQQLGNVWSPQLADGAPGQNWSATFGNRFNRLGIVASITQSYKEQYVEEQRAFYRVAEEGELEAVSDYAMQYGTQRAQLGIVGNFSYQFSPNHRLSVDNFYSHSGRDEGRNFEGPNTENNFVYRNTRLQFIEEGLLSNAVGGEHFLQGLANSRLDWRVNVAQANRDEPDLRETLYQAPLPALGSTAPLNFVLADESQSGFRMFSELEDRTVDTSANWSVYPTGGGRSTQFKFGASYIDRAREFSSRRFRFIPIVLNKDGVASTNLALPPEELYKSENIGTVFRFNEETRPVDAYDGDQQTIAGYGMVDVGLTARTRMVAGARVENFNQVVNTFDPFGLFVRTVTAELKGTDVFPAVNFIQTLRPNTNLRFSYSSTVNRPEFRELAEFEFTDVVGSRATRGNPDLERALIQNVDARWETFLGTRGLVAVSGFYKYFDQPIERVVIGGAQPLVTFQNSDHARNVGFEFEANHNFSRYFFVNANYTFVDSKITLLPEQQTVQTSLERPLAGQSENLFNFTAEFTVAGFATRALFNYSGDRISDVGSNQAPDIIEQGRPSFDLVFQKRFDQGFGFRVTLENLTDSEYLFTQGTEDQRAYKLGRTYGISFGYSLF